MGLSEPSSFKNKPTKTQLLCFFLGSMVGARPEHHASPVSPMIPAAASAAGPPLVASPYPQSYLQYSQVIQAMPPHYHGQVTAAHSFSGLNMTKYACGGFNTERNQLVSKQTVYPTML